MRAKENISSSNQREKEEFNLENTPGRGVVSKIYPDPRFFFMIGAIEAYLNKSIESLRLQPFSLSELNQLLDKNELYYLKNKPTFLNSNTFWSINPPLVTLMNKFVNEACTLEELKKTAIALAEQGADLTQRDTVGKPPATIFHHLLLNNKDGCNDKEIRILLKKNKNLANSGVDLMLHEKVKPCYMSKTSMIPLIPRKNDYINKKIIDDNLKQKGSPISLRVPNSPLQNLIMKL